VLAVLSRLISFMPAVQLGRVAALQIGHEIRNQTPLEVLGREAREATPLWLDAEEYVCSLVAEREEEGAWRATGM
jgi:hypothetical protein